MATGAPDWYGTRWKVETTNRSSQMFPTGRAIISDNFSEPILAWEEIGDAGGSVALTTTYSMTPPNSVKIITDNDSGDYKAIGRTVGLPASQKMGIEMAWSKPTVADSYTVLGVFLYKSSVFYQAWARYSHTLGNWQTRNLVGGWVNVSGSTQNLRDDTDNFHRCKLTMDFNTGKYMYLDSNEDSFDISDTDIFYSATVARDTAQALCGAMAFSDAARTIYIDNATVTEE